MATKTFTTNLKLITSALSAPPTTVQLPLGYAAFGVVNGRLSLWGNFDNTVRDIVAEGAPTITIVQATGSSTTQVMSQNAVTVELNKKEVIANKNAANGYAGLDANGKILTNLLPDTLISGLVYGGTINKSNLATLSAQFKSRFSISSSTLMINTGMAVVYPDVYFIAQDGGGAFTNQTIIGVNNVSTGDWLLSNGITWDKVDNTDAVVSVNGKTGAVTITLADLGGLSPTGNGSSLTNTFSQAATRANLVSGETLATSLSKMMKWFVDLSNGLAFATSITSAQTPVATSTARGTVIVPTVSALSLDGSGNVDVKLGDGIKKNASGQLEADIIITYGVI